jgi:Family of unknown function (DUF5906)
VTDTFDGEAAARADQEFLASLDAHALQQNPLYGAPCPPPASSSSGAEQQEAFIASVAWLLANYAYYQHALMGKGGVISLADGKIATLASLRGLMQPYALVTPGPKGGTKITSPIDTWMMHRERLQIDAVRTRFDQPRPTFVEDGYHVLNRYRPVIHPAAGGDLTAFNEFFARLFPDVTERTWCWHWLAHKARRPWVPMIAVIMVAEEFGSGRGTLFEILGLLFGKDYVVPAGFTELTGTSSAARFNDRMANALFVVVNEAVAEDGHQQTQRRLAYDALKNAVEPSPTALRRFEAKREHAYTQTSAMTVGIATQHRDVVKLPHDDRRFGVLVCGPKMTPVEKQEIRTWMASPENIGALRRALLMTPVPPLELFDPYGVPPPFAGRLEMIGMGKSRIEDAYEAALDVLDGYPLFTMTQGKRIIGYFGDYSMGDWSDRAMHTVSKNAYRLHKERMRYQGRKEVVYARTKGERQRWLPADKQMVVAALDRTEERIGRVINGRSGNSGGGLLDLSKLTRKPTVEDED